MPSRRQVRQAAVQVLYARSASPKDQADSELWELINDYAGRTYDKARVKVFAHFQQGRTAAVTKMQEIITGCAAAIHVAEPNEKLAKDLAALLKAEEKWAECPRALSALAKSDIGGWRRDLQTRLIEAQELRKKRAEILPRTIMFPPQDRSTLEAVFTKLETYDERAHMVQFPDQYPEQRDLDHLHRLLGEMKELEKEALERVIAIEGDRERIDQTIEKAAANFDFERLSKVDLAILQQATWEMLNLSDLDHAVSINEAIELARSFSGEESASFVNGVLDKISKSQA